MLVEKPIAANLSNAELLIQQAEESNCILSVGVLLRFHSGIKYAGQMLEDNEIETRSIYFEDIHQDLPQLSRFNRCNGNSCHRYYT